MLSRLVNQMAEREGVTEKLVDDLRLGELRVRSNPQSGANGIVIVVDTAAALVYAAVIADTGGNKLIIAGRTQPPQAGSFATC